MSREVFIHLAFFLAFFVFITIFRGFFDPTFWLFWFGGLVGTVLPDVDHIIYVMSRENDLTSMRVGVDLSKRKFSRALGLMALTRTERLNLIFHNFDFQVLFYVVAFWVATSSGSVFGLGLVLAFVLHILVDQFVDIMETGSLVRWNASIVRLGKDRHIVWWVGMGLVFLVLGFVL